MMRKFFLLLSVGMATFFTLTGCQTSFTPQQREEKQVVKIWIIAPLSWPLSNYGEDAVKAFSYAVNEFNSSQPTYLMKLVMEDGKCEGKSATSAAQKLLEIDKVDFLIGGLCSSEIIASATVAQQYGKSAMSPTASAGEISKLWNAFRYRSDDLLGAKLWQYASSKAQTIALITENTDFGMGIRDNFIKNYTGTIIDNIVFNSNEKDFTMLIKQLSLADIEGIIFIPQSDETAKSLFTAILKDTKFTTTLQWKMYMPYMCSSDNLRNTYGTFMEGDICIDATMVSNMNTSGQEWLTTYKQTHSVNAIDSWVVFYKEAMSVIGEAILAGNTDWQGIDSFLREYDEKYLRYGYVGDYYFNMSGDAMGLEYSMQRVHNGEVEFLK